MREFDDKRIIAQQTPCLTDDLHRHYDAARKHECTDKAEQPLRRTRMFRRLDLGSHRDTPTYWLKLSGFPSSDVNVRDML